MMSSGKETITLFVAALLLTVWGLFGVLGRTEGYADIRFETDYTIRHVPPDGSLAEAGFLVGDAIVSVEGIPAVDLGMYSRWPLSLSRRAGESLTMTVERDGELVSGEVVYREQPSSILRMHIILLVIFLTFLWAGVWALFRIPNPYAGMLATMGLAAGFSIPGPNLGTWTGLVDHVNVVAEVLWLLSILRFLLFFPRAKRIALAHLSTVLTYVPWVIIVGCLTVELVFHPKYYDRFGGVIGLVMLAYLLAAIWALIHSWIKTPSGEMRRSGLGMVLAGFGVGFGGILLAVVDGIFLGNLQIPGSNWAPVLFSAIPIGMVLGAQRQISGTAVILGLMALAFPWSGTASAQEAIRTGGCSVAAVSESTGTGSRVP